MRPLKCLAENLHPNSQQAENKGQKTIKSLHCDPSALLGVKKTRVQTEIKWTPGNHSNMLLLTIESQTVCLEASVSQEDGALPWHVSLRVDNKHTVGCEIPFTKPAWSMKRMNTSIFIKNSILYSFEFLDSLEFLCECFYITEWKCHDFVKACFKKKKVHHWIKE